MNENADIRAARTRAAATKQILQNFKDVEKLIARMDQMEMKIAMLEEQIKQG